MKSILIIAIIATITFAKLDSYNVDISQTTTGGISSGGYMAVQMHWAYSSSMIGTAVTAGGPFFCAKGSMNTALTACMSMPISINVSELMNKASKFASDGKIDDLSNLKDQNVYLYSGTKDTVVKQGVMEKLDKMYGEVGAKITKEFSIPSEHAYITKDFGSECSAKRSPYINNCDYDMAYESFKVMYGDDIKEPVEAVSKNLKKFDQKPYKSTGYSMHNDAYVYVPTACQNGEACRVHISFHGCQQTLNDIGTKYVEHAGLNEVAEANNIIVLYPQAKASTMAPQNPQGCWDWWGYTEGGISPLPTPSSGKYVSKEGKQMSAIWNMVKDLAGEKVEYFDLE